MENREKMWLELMKFYGLSEVAGAIDNPTIVSWFKEMGHPEIQDDETAWCSLTINIIAKRLGLPYSGKLDARSWMKIGTPVAEPKIGDIVVFWRGEKTGWQGHVGLYAGFLPQTGQILTLGGNQGNSITIRAYPVESPAFGLLGYRKI